LTGRPAVFLDRDGTINVEVNYLHRIDDLVLVPGAAGVIARLNRAGLPVIVVTNQAGIARGMYDVAAMEALHAHLQTLLAGHDAHIDAFYFCPHHPDFTGACACRKPEPGMLLRAAADHGLDLSRSWLIGDSAGDMGAGRTAGCRTILVRTGYGTEVERRIEQDEGGKRPDAVVASLPEAVTYILDTASGEISARS
jgi:D-glycero-D-manno-heptose 1,7-bisphosphate phosphatase